MSGEFLKRRILLECVYITELYSVQVHTQHHCSVGTERTNQGHTIKLILIVAFYLKLRHNLKLKCRCFQHSKMPPFPFTLFSIQNHFTILIDYFNKHVEQLNELLFYLLLWRFKHDDFFYQLLK